ncbi:MAG TPA: alpha/beta hydrolase [Candidatus Thermoplasmatota archaeon]|nr:alpha/beta hydrolase [Candidatus Thermoplasmatota archaeon]
MTEFVTSKDGTRIGYDRLGQGPPLVIVNGALSVRTFVFARKMAEGLATRFTVFNFDRRGRGDSTDDPQYSVAKEVDDVAAMCKAARGKPFVVGFSSGAALALEAAAAGVPMAGLYAYEPPYTRADPNDKTEADFRERLEQYRANGQRDEAVSYFMRTVGVPGFGIAIMKLLPMWKVMRSVAHTLPYDAAVMDRFTVPTQRFAAIKVPTIVAFGAKTSPALKLGAQAAADAVPQAQRRVVPRSNHGVKPKAMVPELAAVFLSPSSPGLD